ncbi:MAG: exo-alpha-sialidase [Planctomycetaceae bacterium]|nr:exo-alpha-sialidase [Planctomycetaceae bacterium]
MFRVCYPRLAAMPMSILLIVLSGSDILAAGEEGTTSSKGTWLAPGVEELPELPMGPFVRLGDGSILTVDTTSNAMQSLDEGKTWQSRPIFADADKYSISQERALFRTAGGVVVLAFMNGKEKANWNWDKAISDSPGARLPTYAVRSPDDGKTWETPQKLHDDWTGAIRNMIQTRAGTIVFTSMMMQHNPGRHSVLTYSSPDDGKTWRRSNVIDLGGVGHHGGVTEATIEQLGDGRIWMLMRTNWKTFWEAYSSDEGVTWTSIGPTKIDASSAPGLVQRLQSGRLVLVWNRYYPEGKTDFPLSGGDNQWSEVPVSNHRLELSVMFSEDDGKTWTEPVVIARNEKGWIAYPYLFELHPGELWVTTMQGGLRARIYEKDFVGN